MPQAAAEPTTTQAPEIIVALRRGEMPLGDMAAPVLVQRVDPATPGDRPQTVLRLTLSVGASVRRYDWMRERYYDEVLVIEPGSVDLTRLEAGAAPLLNTHNQWDLEAVLGVLRNATVNPGRLDCEALCSRRDSVAGYLQDVEDGIVTRVSLGYRRQRIEMVPPVQEGDVWQYRVVAFEVVEGSLVPCPADIDAQVQRALASGELAPQVRNLRTFPCEFVERAPQPAAAARSATPFTPTVGNSAATTTQKETPMPGDTTQAGGNNTPAADAQRNTTAAPAVSAASAAAPAQAATSAPADPAQAARAAEAQRSAEISDLCLRHGMPQLASEAVRNGTSVDQLSRSILEELARRSEGNSRNVRVETVQDEAATRAAGMEECLLHRVNPRAPLTDNGRQFRGMSLIELARDFLEQRGVNTRGMDRMTLAGEALRYRSAGAMGTTDFGSLMSNVANKRLRSGYDENPGSYRAWARQAPSAPDFKNITVVQLSAMPDLLKINEHGEVKYGSASDGGVTYTLASYARAVTLTRQAIVNDDLRAFDRLAAGFGTAARRLENRLVYAQITGNPTMPDNVALFHADHGNLGTGGGSALQFTSLSAGRTAMRLQKGLQKEELNLAPSFLLVPASLEQTAYQLTSSNYVPATKAEVNEFRAGGRTAVEPVIEPLLDAASATAWYLVAANSQVDTVEFTYLEGREGPVIESERGFDVDGMSMKCTHDFAAAVIDYRGLYRAAGA